MGTTAMSELRLTPFGFDWHAARIERCISHEPKKGKGTMVVIAVRGTDDDYSKQLDIYVSPKSKSIRAFRGGKELR